MTNEIKTSASNLETTYLEMNANNAWPILYQSIRQECDNFQYTCDESKKPRNKVLNRYRDVAPYDHSRIILKKGPYDYINANLLTVESAHRKYILTQGPLPTTSGHFWLMVWEQNSKAIVMLNKVIEKEQIKCHQYWPMNNAEPMTFDDVNLEVEFVSKIESSDYNTTVLRLTDLELNESREILHFHYTTWPDFGVPESPTAFLRFLNDVRRSGCLKLEVGPLVIHCSAGIGRTGTFCLVDTCLMLIEEYGLNSVNVLDVLLDMRRSRMGLIQTPDQLRFSYAAIIEEVQLLPSNNVNGTTIENHYDIINNILNLVNQNNKEDDDDDDDEPPPLPPPRGESLTRSMMADQSNNELAYANENEAGPPNKPLPMEPTTKPATNSHSNEEHNTNINSNKTSELRQRHQEKKERLTDQVREIKRRQKESEDWQNFKRSLFNPVTIGIGSVMIGGGVIALCTYLYFRGSKSDTTEPSPETVHEEAESTI